MRNNLCGGVEAMRELLRTQGVTSDAPPRPECSNVSPQQKVALRGLIQESERSARCAASTRRGI
jgi:hypothetical protein